MISLKVCFVSNPYIPPANLSIKTGWLAVPWRLLVLPDIHSSCLIIHAVIANRLTMMTNLASANNHACSHTVSCQGVNTLRNHSQKMPVSD